jgi:hypothetical protein
VVPSAPTALQEDIARSARSFLARGLDILGAVPRQFSWIDQRLVRDRHITRCKCDALALYLLLCTVADAQGASYYSDTRAAALLSLSEANLREARSFNEILRQIIEKP